MDAVGRYYDPLYRRNIAVDFVAPDADLGRYRVLLVPNLYPGRAAVTRDAFGQGGAYYLGTRPDETFMDVLLARVCREAGVHPPLEAPAGIEVVRRVRGERSFLFVLNHTRATCDVHVGG